MRLAIVGGGASAVCIIDALATSATSPGDLTVFDPSPHLWRGRAYQEDCDVVLVNSPVEDMSVRDGDERHYERWLHRRCPAGPFAPRAVFGEYLHATAAEGLAMLRARGWRIAVVREAVTGAFRSGAQVVLHGDRGLHAPFDNVVLAVGGGHPGDVFGLAGRPRFVADPYPVARTLSAIGPHDGVAVIGAGLTAVDVVITLAARGHRGPITLLSRRGVLPAVRQHTITHRLRHFVPAHLHALAGRSRQVAFADVVELLRTELAAAGADLDEVWQEISMADGEEPVARLRRQLSEVGCGRIGLRVLQQAVHVCGPDLWPLLPEVVRREVLARHYRTLMSLCCPMPPSSAATLLRLLDAGQLTLLPGVQRVSPLPGGGFHVATDRGELTPCHVVNGVSAPVHRVPRRARQLVNALYGERLAIPHPDGGLCVDTATSRLVGTGPDGARIHAIGDIAGGTFFFTFGVPSLVDRCRDIVADLLATDRARTREGTRA